VAAALLVPLQRRQRIQVIAVPSGSPACCATPDVTFTGPCSSTPLLKISLRSRFEYRTPGS
jgi:hypothetical protein